MENNTKMDKNLIIKLVCGVGILVSLIVIVVTIFNNSTTASEYNKIEHGMTYGSWKGVTYHLNGANANIMFVDGQVHSKAQIGLIF